jgi:dolichol-phosphate mannosyltransferase
MPIDIVLPVHNEAASIGDTLIEFYDVAVTKNNIPVRFVVCEDGSKDNSVEVLQKLSQKLPIFLITGTERKGYSKAVIDGFNATTSDLVGFIDSDGQCDPADLTRFVQEQATGQYDLVIGYRNPRNDHPIRLWMSWAFGVVYHAIFSISLRDPSCPFLLIRQDSLRKVMAGNVGILKQGFWWEFCARCTAANLRIKQIPVAHRPRAAGETQVYKPTKVPRIAYEHILGLFKLKQELVASRTAPSRQP